MSEVLNVAAYRFVALDDLPALRMHLLASANDLALKGTVILAPEGINLCLAGADRAVNRWLAALQRDARFTAIDIKRSISAQIAFRRLRVKIKREIIRLDMPAVSPGVQRAPSVSPTSLARWLTNGHDETGRPVVMLDARNAFEVDAGAFVNAVDWRLHRFSEFPRAMAAAADSLRGATVVSYCTGGIRCEKAALLLGNAGIGPAYQLEGGILGYFEATRGVAPGWQGHCVVFDERGALDTSLRPATVCPV